MPEDYETVESDVLVIGAGGAGMLIYAFQCAMCTILQDGIHFKKD